MSKDKVKLICDKCNYDWEQTVELFSDIDWKCPKCKDTKEVSTLNYQSNIKS